MLGCMDRAGLGGALNNYRARLRPEDVGMPAGLRRRVPGLRREEVAALAGISVDYLVRLEQGRGSTPSDQVLGALGTRALRLSDDERDHLFNLAGSAPPRPGHIVVTPRSATLRLLDRITDLPALLIDAKGDILAWNGLATALLGDFSAWPPGERNVTWQRFLGTGGRVAIDPEDAPREEATAVASLRAVAARYPDDPGLNALIDDLRARSTSFVELWAEGQVAERRAGRKTVHHPELGRIALDCDTLHIPDVDQRLIVYSAAPGTAEDDALALLRVIGLQGINTDR